MTVKFIQRHLSLNLKSLGELIARHPTYFIIFPCILSAVLSTGFMQMKYDRNYSLLFTAENSLTVKSRNIVETLFPTNTSANFDFFRVTHEAKGILIIATPLEGSNMLTYDIMQELIFIDRTMRSRTINYKGNVIDYKTVCGKRDGKCLDNPVFKLVPHMKMFEKGRYRFKYPIDLDMFTYLYTRYIANLGSVTVDENRYVQTAGAIRLIYPFDTTNKTLQLCSEEWERALFDYLSKYQFKHISIVIVGMSKLTEEFAASTKTIIPLISLLVIIVTVFSAVTCMTNNWLRSKPWLGVAASVSSGLAVIASFGSLFHCGFSTTDINVTLPFLIFATEIDDAYLLIASWRRTNPKESVEKRMGRAYSEAAVSITITSLTNFLSFSVGMIAPFPVVRLFCLYAAVSIIFSYVYQIVFFGGCMALSGYRESNYLNPLTFRKVTDIKEPLSPSSGKLLDANKECMMKFFEGTYSNFLSSGPVKLMIMLIFLANLSIGMWGITQMKYGMDVVHLLNSDSATKRLLTDMLKHFHQYPYPIHVVINKTLNYADPETQKTIEDIIKKFEDHPHTTEPFLTLSWLKYYKKFQSHPISRFSLSSYNVSNKQDFIDGLRNVFLSFTAAKQFKDDIVFNENFTEITASRFILGCKDLYDRPTELQLIKDLQEIAAKAPLPLTIHCLPFPLMEHALLIRGIVFQLAWVIGLLILIVFFFFIPNLCCAVCVALSVISSICETVGFMTIWGVNLDMISILLLILAAGFSINYPTHITFAFLMANEQKDGKLKQSLYEVGWPTVQGSVSTVLGVIILPFQDSYVYICFFKVVFLIAVQTAFHAMFVLPVVLSFIDRVKQPNDLCKYRTHKQQSTKEGGCSKDEKFSNLKGKEEQGLPLVQEKCIS